MYQPENPLTMQGADTALTDGLRVIESGETAFDLSSCESVDSAAVALLLAWQRAALMRGANLTFENPPANLRSLATLYGVEDLLHFHPEDSQKSSLLRH